MATSEKKNPNIGETSGIGMAAFLIQLFKDNAKEHLSDDALRKAMVKEFPKKDRYKEKIKGLREIGLRRAEYNGGHLGTMKGVVPSKRITAYDDKGEPIESGSGSKKSV